MKEQIKSVFKKIAGFFGFIGSIILFIFGYRLGHGKLDSVDRPTTDNNSDANRVADRTGDRNKELADSIERTNIRHSKIDRVVEEARKTNLEAQNLINRINNGD